MVELTGLRWLQRKGYEERLIAQDKLLAKVGLSPSVEDQFLPLYGHWKSADGVHVSYLGVELEDALSIAERVDI